MVDDDPYAAIAQRAADDQSKTGPLQRQKPDDSDPYAALAEQSRRDEGSVTPQEAALRRGERPAYLGPENEFMNLSHLAEDQLGLRDEMVGFGQGSKALYKTGSWDEAKKAYNDALEYARADKRIAREKEGWLGTGAELVGGLGVVGPGKSLMRNAAGELIPAVRDSTIGARVPWLRQDPNLVPRATAPAEAAPGFLSRVGQNAAAGATFGLEKGFAEGEGGFQERAENAAVNSGLGLVAGPVLGEVIPGVIGGGKRVGNFMRRTADEGYDPRLGSDRSLARTMQEAGITPQQIIDEIVPGISAQLGRRPYTQPQIDALVARARNPQTDYDRRILSFLRDPSGRTLPLDPRSPEMAAALNTPEFRQSQVNEMLQRALAGEPLATLAPQYGVHPQTVGNYLANFHARNPTPMNIMDYAERARGQAAGDALMRDARSSWIISRDIEAGQRLHDRNIEQSGRVAGQLQGQNYEARLATERQNLQNASNAAYRQFYQEPPLATNQLADLLEDPTFANAVGMARRQTRADIINQNQQAARTGAPQQPVPSLDRESELFEPQVLDKIQRQLRLASQGHTNPNEARHAGDLRNIFLDRIEDHYPTFRAIRTNYAEGIGDIEAMQAGENLVPKVGGKSRELLADFRGWSPERQELFRLGFERKLTDDILKNPASALRTYESQGFHDLVNDMYPTDRAQQLLDYLHNEFITRRIGSSVFAGPHTAQSTFDLRKGIQGFKAAAELAGGRPWRAWDDFVTWLERRIGTRQARASIRTLTEMRPAEQLENLERLAHVARTDTEREEFRQIMRGLRRKILERGILGANAAMDVRDNVQ